MTRLYLAYGSNLNKTRMRQRCPGARAVGTVTLPEARLIFRGVADVIPDDRCQLVGGLWKISRDDELALDRFEGVGGRFYEKRTASIGGDSVMLYVMTARGIHPPSVEYVNIVRRGYRDFGIDERQLDEAVEYSWTGKDPCEQTSARRARQIARGGMGALLYRPGGQYALPFEDKPSKRSARKKTAISVPSDAFRPSPQSMLMVKQKCADCGDVEWVEKHLKRNVCEWCLDQRAKWAKQAKARMRP